MNKPSPAEDLAMLRDLLSRIEAGELTMRRGHQDVGKEEIGSLKAAITRLGAILEHRESERKSDESINYAGRTKRFSRDK
jgi:hypothetical protein